MPLSPEAAHDAPKSPAADPRAARLAKFKREQVVVDYLNRGVGVAEIAARIGVGEKRMHAIVREILSRRMPAAPREFAAIQVSRLNEALLVAFSAMTDMNLRAVDRVVRIVRELDRYHGFVHAARRRSEVPRDEAYATARIETGAFIRQTSFAPKLYDYNYLSASIMESQPGQTRPAAVNLDARIREHDEHGDNRPEIAAQAIEKIESAPGNPPARPLPDPLTPGGRRPRDWRPRANGGPVAPTSHPIERLDLEARVHGHDKDGDNRPKNPAQIIEKVESAPGNPPSRPQPAPLEERNLDARGREHDKARMPLADNRPKNPAQIIEKIESSAGISRPSGCASVDELDAGVAAARPDEADMAGLVAAHSVEEQERELRRQRDQPVARDPGALERDVADHDVNRRRPVVEDAARPAETAGARAAPLFGERRRGAWSHAAMFGDRPCPGLTLPAAWREGRRDEARLGARPSPAPLTRPPV